MAVTELYKVRCVDAWNLRWLAKPNHSKKNIIYIIMIFPNVGIPPVNSLSTSLFEIFGTILICLQWFSCQCYNWPEDIQRLIWRQEFYIFFWSFKLLNVNWMWMQGLSHIYQTKYFCSYIIGNLSQGNIFLIKIEFGKPSGNPINPRKTASR